jgi:pimeloyl-ACP methyl ester carboxylesterase
MEVFDIKLPQGKLAAARLNAQGERLVILLHGYGDTYNMMLPLAQQFVAKNCEVVLFDLPFHGESAWEGEVFGAAEVAQTLLLLLQNNQKPFELLGYSLGGRLVLASLPLLAKAEYLPENVYLVATAGAPQNFVHRYIEMPLFLKKVTWFVADKTHFLLSCAQFLYKKNLISKFEMAFTEKYLGDAKRRKMMFVWWFSLSFLNIDYKTINGLFLQKNIAIYLFFGENDTVLPKNSALFYKKNLQHTAIKYLDATHRNMVNIGLF